MSGEKGAHNERATEIEIKVQSTKIKAHWEIN
jgi:hypothetical protein